MTDANDEDLKGREDRVMLRFRRRPELKPELLYLWFAQSPGGWSPGDRNVHYAVGEAASRNAYERVAAVAKDKRTGVTRDLAFTAADKAEIAKFMHLVEDGPAGELFGLTRADAEAIVAEFAFLTIESE